VWYMKNKITNRILATGLLIFLATPFSPPCAFARSFEAANPEAKYEPLTEAKLDQFSRRLNVSETRMQALSELIEQCSTMLYPTSSSMAIFADDKTRKVYERAVAMVHRCATKPTIKLALQSREENLNFWALRQVTAKDKDLIPLVEALAVPGRCVWANNAVDTLRQCNVNEAVIGKYIAASKDTDVLMHQIRDDKEFNRRLSILLDDNDESVKKNALDFIGYNEGMAEMYHRPFDAHIFDQVMTLSHSQSSSLRESSVAALAWLKKYDENKVVARLCEMALDASSDVRWRVAVALRKFGGNKNATKTLEDLLKDHCPLVQYFAAMATGPREHIEVLRELSKCSDVETRKMAIEVLKSLETQPSIQPGHK